MIEEIHFVVIERIAEKEPVGHTESCKSGKETFEWQGSETDHPQIEQRYKIEQLWKQQASQSDEKESVEYTSRRIGRFVAAE